MNASEILVLEITNGPMKQSQYRVAAGEELAVGRCRTTDCYIMDPRLSRKHFVISVCDQQWTVRDLESANGTFLNGLRIDNIGLLKEEDRIQAGDTSFRVSHTTNSNCKLGPPHMDHNQSNSDCQIE